MSIKEKIENAEETTWLAEGLSDWHLRWIMWSAKTKAKLERILKGKW